MHLARAASLSPWQQVGVMVITATKYRAPLDAELSWGLGCDLWGSGT